MVNLKKPSKVAHRGRKLADNESTSAVQPQSLIAKEVELVRFAEKMRPKCADWMELHNAIFGIGGKAGELFRSQAERSAFSESSAYKRIQKLIRELPPPSGMSAQTKNAKGAILVRLPKSVHAALLAEADEEGVSLNQLCLAKLCVRLGS